MGNRRFDIEAPQRQSAGTGTHRLGLLPTDWPFRMTTMRRAVSRCGVPFWKPGFFFG
jgi:hypothetical protein